MTDNRIEKIRAFVEGRRKENWEKRYNNSGGNLFWDKANEDDEILSFIDSLQEEPVSEDLEEAAMQYAEDNLFTPEWERDLTDHFKAGAQWQKERINYPYQDNGSDINKEIETFQKWIHDNSLSPTVSLCAHHFANWQKHQIMKDAVEATVHGVSGREGSTMKGIAVTAYADVPDCNFGDKVKVIVIKEN